MAARAGGLMQTRKDLYQAHRLTTQRIALALLQGSPSAAESPLRRTGVGTLIGVMIVVLIAAGFGIAGLIFKGGARNLERSGVVVIEKETGATYAYSAETRKLVPFVNYASARLAMATSDIERKLVSAKSLAKYARGPLTGIPGAPESLPTPKDLGKAPWSLCVRRTGTDTTVSLVGGRDVGGTALAENQGLLVSADSQSWLIWHSTRMEISPRAARVLSPQQPVPVDPHWLNGLPQGPDFAAPTVPGRGGNVPGPNGAPTPTGQVFHVQAIAGTPERWYVQLPDGLSNISATQARLLMDVPAAAPPRDITPAAAASSPSRTNLYSRELPESPPRITSYDPSQPLCTVYRDTDKLSTSAGFTIGGTLPTTTPTPAGLDQVVIPGGATFAGTLPGPDQSPESFALITDQGTRYPIATPDDISKLGYTSNQAVPVPTNLLALFEEGPTLTATAARRPIPANNPPVATSP
ncbi:type VII secretion protein EccB [Actinomadura sp. WMMB 499]|uniref:type VII secretion protein EccB n=1 Tax=Actinomadura sp. WMMB 499 TaxID=1219491 RepID=UPI00124627BF|nr:type VII secretion protein EccB [Actinomadura sp. WMMB 499]QFG21677.1 type VII secretion protein EccB [Actinomadura sp. WMMB 499]